MLACLPQPTFTGTMALQSEKTLPVSHFWSSKLSETEKLQRDQAVLKAIADNQKAIDQLPESTKLTYNPSQLDKTKVSFDFRSFIKIEGEFFCARDIITIESSSCESKTPQTIDLETASNKNNSQTLKRKGTFRSWKFWRTESIDAFIKRAIETASRLTKQQEQSP